jgi:hypothetical protein
MKNRIIYESPSYNNVFEKNNNTEWHMKKILEIQNRENKFLGRSSSNAMLKNKISEVSQHKQHKRSNSPFNLSKFRI